MLKNWLKLTLIFALFVTCVFLESDSQFDSSCNSRTVVNYNFGSSSNIADARNPSNAAQEKSGRIGPPGVQGPKGQKVNWKHKISIFVRMLYIFVLMAYIFFY